MAVALHPVVCNHCHYERYDTKPVFVHGETFEVCPDCFGAVALKVRALLGADINEDALLSQRRLHRMVPTGGLSFGTPDMPSESDMRVPEPEYGHHLISWKTSEPARADAHMSYTVHHEIIEKVLFDTYGLCDLRIALQQLEDYRPDLYQVYIVATRIGTAKAAEYFDIHRNTAGRMRNQARTWLRARVQTDEVIK